VILLTAAAVFLYQNFLSKPETRVLETAKVQRGDIRGVTVQTGIIKPQVGAVVKIGARATGTIVEMKVKIGDQVRQGQLIALIDDRELQRAIEQYKASLAAAQNTLDQIELTYPQRIKEAGASYEYAKLTYDREQELLKNEYTTKDALDRARSQLDAAEAVFTRLQAEYRTQVKITSATIEDITAQLAVQQTRLTYTKIFAPISGIVSDVTAQEGETIVAGLQVANLVTVLDPTRLEMWIYVDETDIGKLRVGQEVEYFVDTYPSRIFKGSIEKIYPQPVVKDNIVYYLAIVRVTADDARFLRPEMTTHVRIIFDEKKDALVAPNAAIKFEKGAQVVYQVTGPNKVQKLAVKIGIRGEEQTELLTGAKEGDELATKLILPVTAKPDEAKGK
jgi:multidrug efflux pump subunit AcrA (membrane-fusion protein)